MKVTNVHCTNFQTIHVEYTRIQDKEFSPPHTEGMLELSCYKYFILTHLERGGIHLWGQPSFQQHLWEQRGQRRGSRECRDYNKA